VKQNQPGLSPSPPQSVAVDVFRLAVKLSEHGLSDAFVADAAALAMENRGVRRLLELWSSTSESTEQAEIVADIQDMIDDYRSVATIRGEDKPVELARISFTDLERIAKDVRTFKDALRVVVDRKGGIGKLAELTGMPQSSISRFFSSNSMPRRSTLLKFARALKLSEIEIATEWVRD
jgi:DNA-binding phage protein